MEQSIYNSQFKIDLAVSAISFIFLYSHQTCVNEESNAKLCTFLEISKIHLLLLTPLLKSCTEIIFGSSTTLHLDIRKMKFQIVDSLSEMKAWLSRLCGATNGIRLKKLTFGWAKQKEGLVRVKLSEVDVPNITIKIREKFTLFGMLYLKTQLSQYSF